MRTIGQYSEAVQILVSRLRNAKVETRKRLSTALFQGLLAKEHGGKVKRDIHRLLLDIYPEIQNNRYNMCGNCFTIVDNVHNRCEKCGREGIDYYAVYFGTEVAISSPTYPPTEIGTRPDAITPKTPRRKAHGRLPMSSPAPRQQSIFNDPAKAVLDKKWQDEVYMSIAEEAYHLCHSILQEYINIDFCPGFYPFPINPVVRLELDPQFRKYQDSDVNILVLSSATVLINDKLHYIHPELNGDILKAEHPLMIHLPQGSPVEIFSELPDGQKRCVRATKYKDRSIIRYWIHEVGGRDVQEGEVIYQVHGQRIVQINKNEYWRALVKMGKRRPKF